MFPKGFEWLGEIPLPRTVNSALFVQVEVQPEEVAAADRKSEAQLRAEWLLNVMADAGKIFVPHEPVELPGGRIVVGDASLYDGDLKVEETPRPDLSDGARRLKRIGDFDPLKVGRTTAFPRLGDIAVLGDVAGIVLGDDEERVFVYTAGGAVEALPLEDAELRRPPYTHGVFTAKRIHLDAERQPLRDEMPELWPADRE